MEVRPSQRVRTALAEVEAEEAKWGLQPKNIFSQLKSSPR